MRERSYSWSSISPAKCGSTKDGCRAEHYPPNLRIDDFETRGIGSDHGDLRLWLRMMAVHNSSPTKRRRRLRTSFNMSLSRFDLMAQLDSNSAGLRMGEISNRLMVTTGNITGLTDELEAEGLVERSADPHSRRALRVRLTHKGRTAFRAAAKANEGLDRRVLFCPVCQRQKGDVRNSRCAKGVSANTRAADR